MKRIMAAMALYGCLAGGPAGAQVPGSGTTGVPRMPAVPSPSGAPRTAAPAQVPPAGPGGQRVFDATSALPGPTPPEELKPVSIPLPDDPLEPYILTKENGPFMVLAQVFRGPDAQRMALALCKELRHDYQLPAYILRTKDWPMKSNIRGVPVQAPSMTTRAAIKQPEKIRTLDEAAVLVGDEKTLQATEALLHRVKKIHPVCLEGMPRLFAWRDGLSHALRTTNPMVPAQLLYPRAPDRLVVSMNKGMRSVVHNPGHFTLQVAMFTGRSTYDLNGKGHGFGGGILDPGSSPLRSAHNDAERLADNLARSPEFRKLGLPVYVHHDRTSSRVFVGAFNSPKDPNIAAVHDEMLKISGKQFAENTSRRRQSDPMIVPASVLTSVDEIKQDLK
jgi:hypothetical protein